jgi:hypothetical protein
VRDRTIHVLMKRRYSHRVTVNLSHPSQVVTIYCKKLE